MGADVSVSGACAYLSGVRTLRAAALTASDLRAAAALVIAAMQAEGESRIFGVRHLTRGYENPVGKLKILGADIKTVEIPTEIVYNIV